MESNIVAVYFPSRATKLSRPLLFWRIAAGFPSPAEDYIERRIDLNRVLYHPP
jgi:DNA polymerase V